jgi:TolB-like protein
LSFIAELRRRRVIRVATVYIAASLGVIYAADVILPRFDAPDWTVTALIIMAGLGFFVAISLAWAFDIVPTDRAAPGAIAAPTVEARAVQVTTEAASPFAVHEVTASTDRRAIAVLPFENMSRDADGDHFSDGIAEEIINALAQMPELRVAGRTSAFSFKGKHEDLRSIGRKLNVGTVLEGSVRQVGSRVRITVQLIDASDGYHLWSERYDRDLHDIFEVQDDIARAVATNLAVKLGSRTAPLIAGHAKDPEAYRLFLTGRHHVSQMMEPGFTLAVEAYRAAIARAPDYALAWAGIGEAELIRGALLDEPYAQSPSRARAAALEALKLNESIAEAHATLGGVQTYFDLDWDGAERSFRRALVLNPGSAWARTWYSELLAFTGRTEQAVAEATRAREIEPLAPLFRWNVMQDLWLARRLGETEREARETLQLFPDAYYAHFFLGMAAWLRNNEAEAVAGVQRAIDALGPVPLITSQLAAVYYSFGRREKGDEILQQLHRRAEQQQVSSGAFFVTYAARGDIDEAIRWLRAGRANRDGFFCQLKTWIHATPGVTDPRLDVEFDLLGFR